MHILRKASKKLCRADDSLDCFNTTKTFGLIDHGKQLNRFEKVGNIFRLENSKAKTSNVNAVFVSLWPERERERERERGPSFCWFLSLYWGQDYCCPFSCCPKGLKKHRLYQAESGVLEIPNNIENASLSLKQTNKKNNSMIQIKYNFQGHCI